MYSQLRVALIEPVGGHGGMDYYDLGLAGSLVSASVDVRLYTCDKTDYPIDLGFSINRCFRGIYGSAPKLWRTLRFVRALLYSLFDAARADVRMAHFHLFHASMLELGCVIAARMFGMRVVITAHDVESFSGSGSVSIARLVYRLADRIIAHNLVSRNELVDKVGVGPAKIAIVPHGHYIEAVNASPDQALARHCLGLPEKGRLMLFFGQIKEVKGLDVLLQAMSRARGCLPDLYLVVAGKVWKDNFSVYENLIQSLDLDDRVVRRIRYIPDEEANLLFRAADLVVLPYRRIYQSGVLLMAMSHGRPVLVSDLPGMTEIICDNVNGFVFRSGDSVHLSARLVDALSNQAQLHAVAEEGFESVRRNHDWHRIGRMTEQVYRAVCQSQPK